MKRLEKHLFDETVRLGNALNGQLKKDILAMVEDGESIELNVKDEADNHYGTLTRDGDDVYIDTTNVDEDGEMYENEEEKVFELGLGQMIVVYTALLCITERNLEPDPRKRLG